MTFGQVVCQCVLVSGKQWFIGCCFRVLPSNAENLAVLLDLVDASIQFGTTVFLRTRLEFTAKYITHLPTVTLSIDQSGRSPSFFNFQVTKTITWLWRSLPHWLSKRQSQTNTRNLCLLVYIEYCYVLLLQLHRCDKIALGTDQYTLWLMKYCKDWETANTSYIHQQNVEEFERRSRNSNLNWSHTVESRSIRWAHVFMFVRQLLKLSSKCEDHIFIWFQTPHCI